MNVAYEVRRKVGNPNSYRQQEAWRFWTLVSSEKDSRQDEENIKLDGTFKSYVFTENWKFKEQVKIKQEYAGQIILNKMKFKTKSFDVISKQTVGLQEVISDS